jgi:hypothetical protein
MEKAVSVGAAIRKRPPVYVWLLSMLTAIWCVPLPFLWASSISKIAGISYLRTLAVYVPELVTGGLVLISFALLRRGARAAATGLVIASVANMVLKFIVGSPSDAWLVTSLLPAALAASLYRLGTALPLGDQ